VLTENVLETGYLPGGLNFLPDGVEFQGVILYVGGELPFRIDLYIGMNGDFEDLIERIRKRAGLLADISKVYEVFGPISGDKERLIKTMRLLNRQPLILTPASLDNQWGA